MVNKTIVNKINKVKELQRQKCEIEKQLDKLTNELKDEMLDRDLEVLIIKGFVLRYTKYTKNCFNKEKFLNEHPRLYKQYTYTQENRRFSIGTKFPETQKGV